MTDWRGRGGDGEGEKIESPAHFKLGWMNPCLKHLFMIRPLSKIEKVQLIFISYRVGELMLEAAVLLVVFGFLEHLHDTYIFYAWLLIFAAFSFITGLGLQCYAKRIMKGEQP